MGGKSCKPVLEPSQAKTLLSSSRELSSAVDEYARLVGLSNAKGKVSKEVFMSEYLIPKLGQHFTQQMLDRVFTNVCVSSPASGPLEQDEFLVFIAVCTGGQGSYDLRSRFVYNLCDFSANERVFVKDFERFATFLVATPRVSARTADAPLPTPKAKATPIEEKDATIKSLVSAMSEALQASRMARDSSVYTYSEWRMVCEQDPRVEALIRGLNTPVAVAVAAAQAAAAGAPGLAIVGVGVEDTKQTAERMAAGVSLPATHAYGFFLAEIPPS